MNHTVAATVTCHVCGGSGYHGGLWDDCCPCCGGSGVVLAAEVAEYETWLSQSKENDMALSEDVLRWLAAEAEELHDDAIELDGVVCHPVLRSDNR